MKHLWIAALTALLIGCAPAPVSPTPTLYVIPTTRPTQAPFVFPTVADTFTPRPTRTPAPTNTPTLTATASSTPTATYTPTTDDSATVAARLVELDYIADWYAILTTAVGIMEDVAYHYNLVMEDRSWGDNGAWRSSVQSDYDLLVILLDTVKADNPPDSLNAVHTATIETLARCAAAPGALGFAADEHSEVALGQSKEYLESCVDMLDNWSTYLLTLQDN